MGEYLRECEASDHMGWNDPANMRVVERIQRNTVTQISSNITVDRENPVDPTASKLSGKLGKKLLPKVGYGRNRSGGSGGGGGSGSKINNVNFSVLSKSISGSELTLEYELKLTQGKKTVEYTVLVESEGGLIDPKSWKNDIGTVYPIEITQFSVKSLSSTTEAEKIFSDISCGSAETEASNEFVSVSLCDDSGAHAGFKIVSQIPSPVIRGTLKIKTADKKYRPSYKIV